MLPITSIRNDNADCGRIRRGSTRNGCARCAGIILRLYLAAALSGCATTPPPSREEARRMETQSFDAGFFTTIRAITNVLQDEGYTIDAAEAETGIVSATKETTEEIAEIGEERVEEESDGIPLWTKALIVATLIPVIIWLISRPGDEEDQDGSSGYTSASASVSAGTGVTAYRYRLTFNIEPQGPGKARVRLSAQGSRFCDGSIEKAGPVHDAAFFSRFFDGIRSAIPPPAVEETEDDNGGGDDGGR